MGGVKIIGLPAGALFGVYCFYKSMLTSSKQEYAEPIGNWELAFPPLLASSPTTNGGMSAQLLTFGTQFATSIYHRYFNLYFTTATMLEWKHLLKKDVLKDVITDSLRFLVQEKRAVVYDFVIMPNHIQFDLAYSGALHTNRSQSSTTVLYGASV